MRRHADRDEYLSQRPDGSYAKSTSHGELSLSSIYLRTPGCDWQEVGMNGHSADKSRWPRDQTSDLPYGARQKNLTFSNGNTNRLCGLMTRTVLPVSYRDGRVQRQTALSVWQMCIRRFRNTADRWRQGRCKTAALSPDRHNTFLRTRACWNTG
jgi:hypothetical protein